ncbi:hypothetical protein Ancab_021437 [Ancistrocladus abbreviatus]
MPSLWKKAKGNRISRLVSDFRSPEKRGSSLVVETGFPTSLVDLFVKNRDRLRKPSKKKRSKLFIDPPPPVIYPLSFPSSPPTTFPVLSPCSSVEPEDSISRRIEPRCSIDVQKEEIGAPEVDLSPDSGENDGDQEIMVVPNSHKRVLASVLKAAFIVILALCTKKLVLGITMAAFVLLLIECVGYRVIGLLKPCKHARERWKSSFFTVNFERKDENGVSKVVVGQEHNQCDIVSGSCHFGQKKVSSYPIDDEIQVVDPNLNLVGGLDEVIPLQAGIDRRCSCERLRFVEMEVKRLVVEEEERRGEVCRIGSEVGRNGREKKGNNFWKKLVSKKLHCGKKKKNRNRKLCDSVSGNMPTWEDEEGEGEEEYEEEEYELEEQEVIDNEGSPSPPLKGEREQELIEKIEQFDVVNGGDKEARKFSERLKRRNGSLKYLFMVMIVLAGLVKGRIVAFVLTVICCLAYKMVRSAASVVPPIKVTS